MTLCLAMLSVAMFAQRDVTKFLGIPVDGTVKEMKTKLMAKGFKDDPTNKSRLLGRFNGKDVDVYIVENGGKVYRIMVCDQNTVGESDIKINYNNLCRQFHQNKKYFPLKTESENIIPDDEDISYELSVHKKRYSAGFVQVPTDTASIQKAVLEAVQSKYALEQIQNPTNELREEIQKFSNDILLDILAKHNVWIMLSSLDDYSEKYYLVIFYDNGYNMANGEDL